MNLWLYISIFLMLASIVIIIFALRKKHRGGDTEEVDMDMNKAELLRYKHMRTVSLGEPLTERMRPKSFNQIIGQQEGIAALKAALATENPQHIILYGPPGVGKTAAARLALDYVKNIPSSPFMANAPFVELDGATARFDERGIADPLMGSVHDPIYQGAGALGNRGVPQPKPGAVNKAHGGVLFIDEIGELHHTQINKLLKVLEDRRVMPESAYYNPYDKSIPDYIHDLFKNGLPADFRLIGATTRSAEELPEALRSRCVEIYFRGLLPNEIAEIACSAAKELELGLSEGTLEAICRYAQSGRDAVNILQLAKGFCDNIVVYPETIERIAQAAHYKANNIFTPSKQAALGVCYTISVGRGGCAVPVRIEAEAFPAEQGQLIISASDSDNNSMEVLKGIVLKAITAMKRVASFDSDEYDIHINFELGGAAVCPSFALGIACAVYSACGGSLLRPDVIPCAELSLCGELLPMRELYSKKELLANYPSLNILCRSNSTEQGIINADNLRTAFDYALSAKSDSRLLSINAARAKLSINQGGQY